LGAVLDRQYVDYSPVSLFPEVPRSRRRNTSRPWRRCNCGRVLLTYEHDSWKGFDAKAAARMLRRCAQHLVDRRGRRGQPTRRAALDGPLPLTADIYPRLRGDDPGKRDGGRNDVGASALERLAEARDREMVRNDRRDLRERETMGRRAPMSGSLV
jgi:hypothetical protein